MRYRDRRGLRETRVLAQPVVCVVPRSGEPRSGEAEELRHRGPNSARAVLEAGS